MSNKIMVKLSKKEFNIIKLLVFGLFLLLLASSIFSFCSEIIFPEISKIFLGHIFYWIWSIGFSVFSLIYLFFILLNSMNLFSSYKRYCKKIEEDIEIQNWWSYYWYKEKTVY